MVTCVTPIKGQNVCGKAMSIANDQALGHARFYASHYYQIACECSKGVPTQEISEQNMAGMKVNRQNYNEMKPASAPSLPTVSCKVSSSGGGGSASGGSEGGISNPDKYQLIDGQTMGLLNNLSMSSSNDRFKEMVGKMNENQAKIDMMRSFATSQEDIEFQNFIGSVAQGATIIGALFGNKDKVEQPIQQTYQTAAEMHQDDVFQETYRLYNAMMKSGYPFKMKYGLEFYRAYLNEDEEGFDQSLQAFFDMLDAYDDMYKAKKEELIIKSLDPKGSPQDNITYFQSLSEDKQALVASDRLFFLDLNNIVFGKEYAVDYDRNEFILNTNDARNQELGEFKADRSIKEASFYINYYLKKAEVARNNGAFYSHYINKAREYLKSYYLSEYPASNQTNYNWPQYYPAQLFMKGMIRLNGYDHEYLFSMLDDFFQYEESTDVEHALEKKIEERIASSGYQPHKNISYFDSYINRYLEYRYLKLMELKFLREEEVLKNYMKDMMDDTIRLLGHENHKVAWKLRREFDYESGRKNLLKMYKILLDVLMEDHELAMKYRSKDMGETLQRIQRVSSWNYRKELAMMEKGILAFKDISLQTYFSNSASEATWMIRLDNDYVTKGIKDRTGVWSYNSVGGQMDIDGYLSRLLYYRNTQNEGQSNKQFIDELFEDYSLEDVYAVLYEFDRTHLEIPDFLKAKAQNITDPELFQIMHRSSY
jgi:hypothetical protein